MFYSPSRIPSLAEYMIDFTSRWECFSLLVWLQLLKIIPTQTSKGTWGSSPWLESGTELELHLYGEMIASWDLEGRCSVSAQRWRLVGGKKNRNSGLMRQVVMSMIYIIRKLDILEKVIRVF